MPTPPLQRHRKRPRVDALFAAPVLDESLRDLQDTVVALTAQLRTEHAARLAAEVRADKAEAARDEMHRRRQRLAAIGESTAEFAHQVRTPLASMLLHASRLEPQDERQAEVAGKIVAGIQELRRMIDDMLGFAAGVGCARQHVNVTELLHEVRDILLPQLGEGTQVAVSVTDPSLAVFANRDGVKGALMNLVCNADQASTGSIDILLHAHRFADTVHLCVTDDGPGIPDGIRARLFEPFFTTRSHGTGLGLAIVKAVAEAHGGSVDIRATGRGTSFSLQLSCEAAGSSGP